MSTSHILKAFLDLCWKVSIQKWLGRVWCFPFGKCDTRRTGFFKRWFIRNFLKRRLVWNSNYLSLPFTHTTWVSLHYFNFCSCDFIWPICDYFIYKSIAFTPTLYASFLYSVLFFFIAVVLYCDGMLISSFSTRISSIRASPFLFSLFSFPVPSRVACML